MKARLKDFFDKHPEAKECHVALGYTHASKDEALAILAGVEGEVVKTYTKEQAEAMGKPPVVKPVTNKPEGSQEQPKENKIVSTFKKLPLEKMPQLIEQQEGVVKQHEAKAAEAAEGKAKLKAQKAVEFHKSILTDMKAAHDSLKAAKEGKKLFDQVEQENK